VPTAHEALDRVHGSPGIGDGLPLGRIANETVAFVSKSNDARGKAVSFLVRDDFDFATLHHRNYRVRRA
jgi:hypothetical protein